MFCRRAQAGVVEHSLRTLIGQRVFGMALEYEDLNDPADVGVLPLEGECRCTRDHFQPRYLRQGRRSAELLALAVSLIRVIG
jgi:hypothetical protein